MRFVADGELEISRGKLVQKPVAGGEALDRRHHHPASSRRRLIVMRAWASEGIVEVCQAEMPKSN